MQLPPTTVPAEKAGVTLAKFLREALPNQSWSQIQTMIQNRRVLINNGLCLDHARRVKEGEVITLLKEPIKIKKEETTAGLVIRYLDEHIVVVEKVSGLNTVRHPAELEWKEKRKALSPTLEDLTQEAIALRMNLRKYELPRLRIVHRIDKDTSGLVVFARSAQAERHLGSQFKQHTVTRRYLAIVTGHFRSRSIESWLVRDRGDGRRGSGLAQVGKRAVTHIEVLETLPQHTLLSCQLETGRTHQIRIHLSEAGHPICGETVYIKSADGKALPTDPTAPRLCLHAAELGLLHPARNEFMAWEMPLPEDLKRFLDRIRKRN